MLRLLVGLFVIIGACCLAAGNLLLAGICGLLAIAMSHNAGRAEEKQVQRERKQAEAQKEKYIEPKATCGGLGGPQAVFLGIVAALGLAFMLMIGFPACERAMSDKPVGHSAYQPSYSEKNYQASEREDYGDWE